MAGNIVTLPVMPEGRSTGPVSTETKLDRAEAEIGAAWKQTDKHGLHFGEVCYKWRNEFKSKGGAGSKGTGLVQVLDRLEIPRSTAYWWIERYEIAAGIRQEKPPQGNPATCTDCGAQFPSLTKYKRHARQVHGKEYRRPPYPPIWETPAFEQTKWIDFPKVDEFRAAHEALAITREQRKHSPAVDLLCRLDQLLHYQGDGVDHVFVTGVQSALEEDTTADFTQEIVSKLGEVISSLVNYQILFQKKLDTSAGYPVTAHYALTM
jgi:hypothetical protein